jgi:hypothetical protein
MPPKETFPLGLSCQKNWSVSECMIEENSNMRKAIEFFSLGNHKAYEPQDTSGSRLFCSRGKNTA